jgi:hypothetical protein
MGLSLIHLMKINQNFLQPCDLKDPVENLFKAASQDSALVYSTNWYQHLNLYLSGIVFMQVMRVFMPTHLSALLSSVISHMVERFSDVSECQGFFMEETSKISGILVDGNIQDQNRFMPICIRTTGMQPSTTQKNIPVFSAYTFTGTTKGRPNVTWMIEPQLEGGNETMSLESKCVNYTHQAVNKDYRNSLNTTGVNRGAVPKFARVWQ